LNYKYYIYKQNTLAGFDKYDLSHYVLLREITNNAQWSLKIARDREWFTVIRSEFDGEITVKGADFDALIALEETHLQYAVVIHRECSHVFTEFWKGYFSYFDFKVDLDRCYLSFKPEVWDEYTPIYDLMPVEYNVLSCDDNTDIAMDVFTYPYETYTDARQETNPSLAPWATWTEANTPPTPGNQYYLISHSVVLSYDDFPDKIYDVVDVYARDYGYSASDTVGPSADAEWVLDPGYAPDEYSPGIYRWVRPYRSMDSEVHVYNYNSDGINAYETIQEVNTTFTPAHGLKLLVKLFEYFGNMCGVTFKSHFFEDSPCPMGGSTLQYTMIQQISNLRAVGEWASRGMMKLKDLLAWVRDTFNVYWFIDSLGDWRFEHRKYFDYGLSYSYTHVIELDLSTLYPTEIKNLNRYEWETPEIMRYEAMELANSYSLDWVMAKIEYPQFSIRSNETNKFSSGWSTDIMAMWDTRDELSKTGWIIYNVDYVLTPVHGLQLMVINTIGAFTGVIMPNARFSHANLLRDLWTWGRILPSGNVNGTLTAFDSIEKLRKQVTISIPQCCVDLDYNGLYRTELGDGLIDSADYESQSGTLKLNLIYE